VLAQLRHHVVKEGNACIYIDYALAIEIEFNEYV
jgi:hypothetical protein